MNLFEVSLLTDAELEVLQAPSFTMASLSFTALAPGTTALDITIKALSDQSGNGLDGNTQPGTVDVTRRVVVPGPWPLALLALGMVTTWGLRKTIGARQRSR